ncbi:MAG: 50S ribosomal protein L23 [Marinilabiliales bacterium]|nr:50S ribosomal protein L23 [Marinilabiliales bacterium]
MVEILIRPIVTEKMNAQAEKLNRYGFMVDKRADKLQIKRAVEEIYGVKVVSVNTMVYSGKFKSRFTKSGVISGRTNAYKKAIVTLNEGENIDFYSNI